LNELIGKLKQPATWTLSVQLLVLYVVSVAIFFAANAVQKKAADGIKGKIAAGSVGASAGLVLLTAALNFAGVAALVVICKKTGENIRMAMVLLPLFLIVEQHVRAMRNQPQERRVQLLGIAGVALGMGAAVAMLMPHAPLK